MAERILLVDDDDGFLRATGCLLESEGFEVAKATDVDSAREQLRLSGTDLIVLDVVMPGKDGFSFAHELARHSDYRNIPIVLVTAVAEQSNPLQSAFENLAASVRDVLPKSRVSSHLVHSVRKALC